MSKAKYLSATEAARMLGVSKATLYAYVCRGRVRSRATQGSRRREYAVADVRKLIARKQARADPPSAVRDSLGMRGLPVLRSELSLIDGGRLHYRGHDVVQLARTHSLEDVAELLWQGGPHDVLIRAGRTRRNQPLVPRMQARLGEAMTRDPAASSLHAPSVRRCGAAILRLLTAEVSAAAVSTDPIATQLAHAWDLPSPDPIDTALVLCADHGLNVSAFTARCVASAGSSIYLVVGAALGALAGRRHGGHTQRVAAMLDETGSITKIIARHIERDGELPGFGHALYPDGDPRARALLDAAPPSSARARARRFERIAAREFGLLPTLDLGLVSLCRSLGAPAEAPFALFALGRTVGWIAHAIEQYASGQLIRPRAEYVGPAPHTNA